MTHPPLPAQGRRTGETERRLVRIPLTFCGWPTGSIFDWDGGNLIMKPGIVVRIDMIMQSEALNLITAVNKAVDFKYPYFARHTRVTIEDKDGQTSALGQVDLGVFTANTSD